MKQLFTLMCTVFALSTNAQSEPMPFPTDQIWMINKWESFTEANYYFTLEYTGETIIDEVSYFTLESTEGCAENYEHHPKRYIRDEGGKWYIKDNIGTPERLYFDFNLEEGDTFDFELGEQFEVTVASVEEVTMADGSTRRLWSFVNSGYQFLEGAGEIRGSFYFWPDVFTHIAYYITCLKDTNNNLIYWRDYPENQLPACCPVSSVEEITESPLSLYPNPATDILYIKQPYTGKWNVQLYNNMGRLISSQEIYHPVTGLNIEYLPTSIYSLVCIDSNNRILTKQFIKQ